MALMSSACYYRLEGNADRDEVMKACNVACWCIQDEEKKQTIQVCCTNPGRTEVSKPAVPKFIRALFFNEEDDNLSRM
ncbi:hypothetical protein SLE2022_393730 [Rubroshorea leprosula]